MSRTKSREQRRATFMAAAGQFYDQLENWYEQHPEASLGEVEAEARRRRRELMGVGLSTLINGRDTGFQLHNPTCEKCGQRMEFEGYREKGVVGLEGEMRLERAYYGCPTCAGQTLFPPGPQAQAATGSLE